MSASVEQIYGVNYDVIIRKTSVSRSFNDPLKILEGFISFGRVIPL